jgi:hypothetical protein
MRWLVMLAGLLAIVLPLLNNSFSKKSKLPGLVFMIVCDIQLLLGLILYFGSSAFGIKAFDAGMSHVIKSPEIRKITVEHFILMLIAVALVHIGYKKIKSMTDQTEIKSASMKFFGIALALILLGIPWFRLSGM